MSNTYKKSLIFLAVAASALTGLYFFESKKTEVKNYEFKDKWTCYQNQGDSVKIMHLKFTDSSIVENDKITEGYEIFEDRKNYSEYEIFNGKDKFAHIIEIKKNKIEYKKNKEKDPYICKRNSSFKPIEDFTGKWMGYVNMNKNDKKKPEDEFDKKIIITIYKDGLYLTGENINEDFLYQKIKGSRQEDGLFKIKLEGMKRDLPVMQYKIINNKELILLPTKELTEKETYFKRIDRFQ